ncbi:probable E3 ubiquitin-protein ligase RHB1A [Solanum lycopersicum]|uniref:RING-type E3 ubiquitin transferase n=1 Tax=Solanum lycopersicum TaxID=4081 RepID=A0A3Q7F5G9_SOLLC|nr:probable E3 ubiquitin-protein ligase RHB1A [Solanum lycopersicum]XP_004229943.1 probable E3 ubiquitin-protein ligase RHB1A [Solanum lycopersicum]
MGGCCCSSRKPPQLHGTQVFYYFPPASEEYESLTSDDSAAIAFTSELLDDLNVDRSTPDTYRSPPAPIPFEVDLGHPQSRGGSQFIDETLLQRSYEITNCKDIKFSDRKAETESLLASLKKAGIDLVKSNPSIIKSAEEEDVCPTCLEEYDVDNPRIVSKCNHHFHLSCILEWMERSQTCPICDQEMVYEAL